MEVEPYLRSQIYFFECVRKVYCAVAQKAYHGNKSSFCYRYTDTAVHKHYIEIGSYVHTGFVRVVRNVRHARLRRRFARNSVESQEPVYRVHKRRAERGIEYAQNSVDYAGNVFKLYIADAEYVGR